MIEKKILFELPVTSDDFISDVSLEHLKGNSLIKFSFINRDNKEKICKIDVIDVFKFIFTSESCCNPLQIENSYEQAVSIEKSVLTDEVVSSLELNGIETSTKFYHFMIYIPDLGCCEFVAKKITNSISDK
jgi:hypothetical protein